MKQLLHQPARIDLRRSRKFLATAMRDRLQFRTPNLSVAWAVILLVLVANVVGARDAAALDKVTVVTDFGINGRHAYYFVAIDKGYYAKEGLAVDVVRGRGSVDAIKQVAAGTAQFGFADAISVALARANDGVPIKMVASVYAQLPQAIFVLADSHITVPTDFEGKRFANVAAGAGRTLFNEYARLAKIDANKVTWVSVSADAQAAALAMGRVDGVTQLRPALPLLARLAAPKKVREFDFAAVGLDAYGNGLIAPDATIAQHQDLVRRFVQATLAGLYESIAHPNEAGMILAKYHREIDPQVAAEEITIVGRIAKMPSDPLGYLARDRMAKTVRLANSAFALNRPVTVDEMFDTDFVKR
jgi:NitT/TauT family transport system substrate-binding protein